LARITVVLFSLITIAACSGRGGDRPLEVVPSVDLNRYAGKWYEVARLPNRFERDCARDVTATYTLRPDGKITVLNECRKENGQLKSAKGTAKLADKNGPNTKLRVTFFWPFYGDYWIIDLDPEYRWAVVGEPGREFFWILSRTPSLPEDVIAGILERARGKGFELGNLIRPEQTAANARGDD
jgi:apolipoprotein D and lipocalin family protein